MYQGEAILPNHPGNTTGMRGVSKKDGGETWSMRKGMVPLGNSAHYHPCVTFLPIWGILLLETKDSVSSPARLTVIIKYVPSVHIYACI